MDKEEYAQRIINEYAEMDETTDVDGLFEEKTFDPNCSICQRIAKSKEDNDNANN